jgi:hypothetical protein
MANDQQNPPPPADPADRLPIDARVFHLASGAVWEVEAVWPQPDAARITAEAALQYYLAQKIAAGDGPEAMRARAAVQGKKARYDSQLKAFREVQKKENLPEVQYAQVSHIFNRPNGRVEVFAFPFGPWEKVGITISTSLPIEDVMIDTIWGVNPMREQIKKLELEAQEQAEGEDDEEEEDEDDEDEDEDEDEDDGTGDDAAPPAKAPTPTAPESEPDDDFRPPGLFGPKDPIG